jgi:hypothetical protein
MELRLLIRLFLPCYHVVNARMLCQAYETYCGTAVTCAPPHIRSCHLCSCCGCDPTARLCIQRTGLNYTKPVRFLPLCKYICFLLHPSFSFDSMTPNNYSDTCSVRPETELVTDGSKVAPIELSPPRPHFTNIQSDTILRSTGSPVKRNASRSRSLTASATRNREYNQPFRIVSDSVGHPKQSVDDATRILQCSIPRKRQRLDNKPGADADEPSSSKASSSPSTPNVKGTRQSRQDHDGSSPVMTPKTARSTHDSLYGELLKNPTPGDQKGFIYILCDSNNRSSGYKIGKTRRAYRDRIVEHERGCNFTPQVVYVSDHEVDYCGRLEKLVHIDLENHCAPLRCDKHKSFDATGKIRAHSEWFQVTEEMAVQTVKRWENFMQQEKPYNWDRRLKTTWRHIFKIRSPEVLDVRTLTHDARREHWEKILAPPTTAELIQVYQAHAHVLLKNLHHFLFYMWMYTTEFFWPLSTLIYGMITLAVFQNLLAFYAFAFILGCAGARILSYVQLSTPKRRPRTPNRMHT